MRDPASDATYYLVRFERAAEAAAFIAALSRFLDAPGGSAFLRRPPGPDAVEVWSHPTVPGDSVEVYLSRGALDAATAAFAPVCVDATHRGDALPRGITLQIGDGRAQAWGLADAEQRLRDSGPWPRP